MVYFGGEFQALEVAAVSINANLLLCYLRTWEYFYYRDPCLGLVFRALVTKMS